MLKDACCIFSPDAILRWHRNLIARKYDGSKKKSTPGGKRISEEVEQLIIQIACKNKTWGSRRIKGQPKYLGHNICHTTIDNATRKVNVAGIIEQAHGEWMLPKARNLADQFSGS